MRFDAARESSIRVAIASGRAWHEMDDVIDAMPCLRYFIVHQWRLCHG